MPWEEDLDLEIVCASHFFSKSPVKSYFKEYRYIKYVLWPMSSTVNKDTTYLETAHKSLQSIYMKTVNSQILLEVFSTTRFITLLQAYRQTTHKEIGNLTRGSGGGGVGCYFIVENCWSNYLFLRLSGQYIILFLILSTGIKKNIPPQS